MARRFSLAVRSGAAMIAAWFSCYDAGHAQTLADAIAATFQNNPDLEDARLGVRASKEDVWQARSAYVPSVNLEGSAGQRVLDIRQQSVLGPVDTHLDQETSAASAIVTQKLYTGGRRGAQMHLARAGLEGARQNLRIEEQNVLLQAVQAYVNVVRDDGILAVRLDYVKSLETQLDATRRRLDVGEVTRTDLSQSQARLAGARGQLAQAQADAATSHAKYVEVTGVEPSALQAATVPAQAPRSLEEAVSAADAHHPKILEARENERAAAARVGIDRSAYLPQLSIVGRADSLENTDQLEQKRDSTSVTAELSVPLFDGGFGWSRTRQAHITLSRAKANLASRRQEITAQVAAAWNEAAASREIIAAARQQVTASDDAVKGAERELGIGTRSTTEVLDARQDLQSAQITLLQARARGALANYALLAAVGELDAQVFQTAAAN